MAIVLLCLAVLLVYLWFEVHEFSLRIDMYEKSFDQLKQHIFTIDRKLQELQTAFRPQTETVR
jgi:uncharacterized protein YoxC